MVGRKQGILTLITLLLTKGGQLEVIEGDRGLRGNRGDAGGKGWSVKWLTSWEKGGALVLTLGRLSFY